MLRPKRLVLLSLTLLSVVVLPACGGGDSPAQSATDVDGQMDGMGTVADDGDSPGIDAGVDGDVDAGTDGGDDAGADGGTDAGADGGADAGADGGADAGADGGADAGADGGADAGADGGADAGADGGSDSGADGGTDAGADGGVDAGTDGGTDGGTDISGATATVIYAAGGPVPGLPDATFVSLTNAAMAANGDACFSARYEQNNELLNGLWCGAADAPQQILRSGDTVDNLPANIVFDSAATMSFADNGNVMIAADVSGASNGAAMLLWDGQSVRSIIRTGELAPDFTDGSVVATLEFFELSNTGAVFHGTSSLNFGSPALWYWDGTDVSLISQFSGTSDTLPADQNNCLITVSFPGLLGASHINNNGTVAFLGQLNRSEQSEDPDLCRGLSVVQKTGNTYTTVVKLRDPVPSTETAQFATIQLGELFDSGAMLIYSSLRDDNASGIDTGRLSSWIFQPDGRADLVTIVEETVPPGFVDRISLIGNVPTVLLSGEDTALQLTQTSLGTSLLAGPPHSGMPYPDIGAVGATTMSLIASTNSESLEGLPDDSFISSFSRPAIDQSGRVFYRAQVEIPSQDVSANAFYTAIPGQTPTLIFSNGSMVDYDGESRLVTNITLPNASQLSVFLSNLPGVLISQQNDALVPVMLEGIGRALIHVSLE